MKIGFFYQAYDEDARLLLREKVVDAFKGGADKHATELDFSGTNTDKYGALPTNKIDVFVNGQLLLSGGNIGEADAEDYHLSADDKVKFSFALEPDDLVTVIVRG